MQNKKRVLLKKILSACLIPIPIVFFYAYYTSVTSINSQLNTIADSYAKRIDSLVADLHDENAKALYSNKSCAQIQEDLLFESLLREMLIVEDQQIVCSSKRGEMQSDISYYYPDGIITSKERFFDLQNDPAMRTLLVIDADKNNPYRGAISVVDQGYIQARLGYHTDTRIAKLIVKVGNEYYPANSKFITKQHNVKVNTANKLFTLQIVASDSFVTEQITFYLLSALPASIALSFFIYALFLFFTGRTSLLDDLKRGLERHELFLVYQPVIDSQKQNVVGYEALLRWINPKLGFVKPDTFIQIAEEYGLINKVTDYVINQVQKDAQYLPNHQQLHLSINVPPCYLSHQKHIHRLILCASHLAAQGIQLVVEITERQLLDQKGQAVLHELRQAGVMISIDDFGTGQTSLSVLQHIAFDYLKIDKCFIDSIGVQSVSAPILNTIIELAHQLKVNIVAEGVEHAAQAKYLANKGVQYQQGYFYSKPLDLSTITKGKASSS